MAAAPPALPPSARVCAGVLATAALAGRRSDPAIQGRIACAGACHHHGPAMVTTPTLPPTASATPPPVASCSHLQQPPASLRVPVAPQPTGVCCLLPSNWVDAASSDHDDDEELAPRSPLAINAGTASRLLDELHDSAVVVEGLGSLALSPATSGGSIFEVPIPASTALLPPSLLWVASLSSDEDDCDEVLAPHLWPLPKVLSLTRCLTLLMCVMMRRCEWSPATISMLLLPLGETRRVGCRWVWVAALAASHHRLSFRRSVSSVVSPSSVGLEGVP
jgi:hypothetical protein